MAKTNQKSLAATAAAKPRGTAVTTLIAAGTGARKATDVTYGAVTVTATIAQDAATKANIKSGQEALARAAGRLLKPGVSLNVSKDVPLYYIDQKHPDQIVRVLNGKKERGVLKNGAFKISR